MPKMCPYVVRATLLPDFTLPDGTAIDAPGQYLCVRPHVYAPTQIIQRDRLGVETVAHPHLPTGVAKRRLVQEIGISVVLNYGRNITESELSRIQISQGWAL